MSVADEHQLKNWWAEGDTPVHTDSASDLSRRCTLNLPDNVPPFSHGTQVHLHFCLGVDSPDGTGAWKRPARRTRW